MSKAILHIAEIPYPSGLIQRRYAFIVSADGSRRMKHGRYVEYHPDGTLAAEGTYANDAEHGEWRDYHPNGQLAASGLYVNGKEEGVWHFWDEQGRAQEDVLYRSGVEQEPA